jgi:ABC-2 type transport system permease protein
MLFTRMVFAWVDRWLSTRRARELLTFCIVLVSLGIQYVNFTFNGFGRHSHRDQAAKIAAAVRFYHHLQPLLAALPPGQAAGAILNRSQDANVAAALNLLGVLLSAAIFFVIFAWRMQREYRGENLSEVNHSPVAKPVAASASSRPAAALAPAANSNRNGLLSTGIAAAMQKEWIYIRRNPTQLYGLVVPLAMVFLFTARANTTMAHNEWIFPGAVAYSLLGISAQAYNSLGLDASGIQFYFLAPVAMRTIFLAKNLVGFAINLLQIVLIYLLLCFTAGAPGLTITVATVCWAVFSALVNVTFGNMRSIAAPKRIDPSKMSRRQASQLSALISLGLALVAGAIGFGVFLLAALTGIGWLPIPILLALDGGAFALYATSLGRLDKLVENNRETILEELTKVAV